MRVAFTKKGWEHFNDWFMDKRTLKKINSLIEDILRNGPLHGTGKPEQLKHYETPTYSRRIDEANRLVYWYDDDIETITIISCIGHYK